MKARIVGYVLNYYTGEQLPVVEAKVVDLDENPRAQATKFTFETNSDVVMGTFAFNESVQRALVVGAAVQVAIGFVLPFMSQTGTRPTPTVMMVGLRPNAIDDDEEGIVVYSEEAR